MKSPNLVCRTRSNLLIVDVQEKLLPVIENREQVISQSRRLLQAASLFEIPITVSEQYPKGLGPTANDLNIAQVEGCVVIEKTTFSCREWMTRFEVLKSEGRDQVIIAGMESHICVLQSAMDLSSAGLQVFLVADAIGSRATQNTDLAIQRCAQSGIYPLPTESVLFEWCESSSDQQFKTISSMVR